MWRRLTLVVSAWIFSDRRAVEGAPPPRVVDDVNVSSGGALALGSVAAEGGILLCPRGARACAFAPNSTLEVHAPATNVPAAGATTVVTIGVGGLHIPNLVVRSGATVILVGPDAVDGSSPSWTFESIRLLGGTLEITGKSAEALCQSLTFSSGITVPPPGTNRSTIVVASGAHFSIVDRSSPLRVTRSSMVHVRHASSKLQVSGGLMSEKGAIFLWTLGGNSADPLKFVSQIAGNIFVEGRCVIDGGMAVVRQDSEQPVKVDAGLGMTVSSLMSAVEFSGNFDSIVLGKQVECARASTSESWSSFSVLVSSRCLSQCAERQTCTDDVPSPAVNGGSSGTSEIVGEDGSVSNVLLVLMTLTAVASIVVLLIAFGRHLYLARCTRADELSGISHPGISSKRQPKADLVEGEADMVSLLPASSL
eukprot:g2947.t1